MTFAATLPAAVLANAAARLATLTDRRISIPIMEHVVLRFEEGGLLAIAASNFDQTLVLRVEAEGEGECTVNAQRLSAAAARLERGDKVALAADSGAITIAQRRARWKLPTLPVADYPLKLVEPLCGAPSWEVEGQALLALVRRVESAAARGDIARPYICGIHFDLETQALAATDGNTLAVAAMGAAAPPKKVKAASFTLPIDALRPLLDLAKGADRIVISRGESEVAFAHRGEKGGPSRETVRCRLLEGDFPQYRRIIPESRPNRFEVHAAELAAACARASVVEGDVKVVAKAKIRINRLSLAFAGDELAVCSHNMSGEEAHDACPMKKLSGDDVSLNFKTEYLLAAVESFGEAATLELGIAGPAEPVLITRAGDESRAAMRIISPMR